MKFYYDDVDLYFFQVHVMSQLWFQVQRVHSERSPADGIPILDVSLV